MKNGIFAENNSCPFHISAVPATINTVAIEVVHLFTAFILVALLYFGSLISVYFLVLLQ